MDDSANVDGNSIRHPASQLKLQGSYAQAYRSFVAAPSPGSIGGGQDVDANGGISVMTTPSNQRSASPARRYSSRKPSILDREPQNQMDMDFCVPAALAVEAIPSAASTTSSKNAIFFEDFNAHSIYQQSKSLAISPSVQDPYDSSRPASTTTATDNSSSPLFVAPSMQTNRRSSTHSRSFQKVDARWSVPTAGSVSSSGPMDSTAPTAADALTPFTPALPPPAIEDIRPIINDGLKLYHVPIAKNILGEGRYAVVYKGSFYSVSETPVSPTFFSRQESNQSAVCAVKCLHLRDSEAQNNGIIEAFIMNELQNWNHGHGHDNIVKLITVDEDADPSDDLHNENGNTLALLLGLEFCSLGQLSEFITKNTRFCGRRRFISWSKQLASAVAFLHRGRDNGDTKMAVIHHDIKPHNVLLDSRMILKLADFGSATLVRVPVSSESPPIFKDGLGLGTQAYSPPETLSPPNFTYSFSADIYSLGCTFYYLLTGREPFANLRNPAHQLWCIRRGFWESGANPLVPLQLLSSSSSNLNEISEISWPRPGVTASLSIQPSHEESRFETHSATASPLSLPLMQFLNGETLHADLRMDSEAYFRIVSLLRKCTAVNHLERPSADGIVKELNLIDDVLILGTGFDELEQHDAQVPAVSERVTDPTTMTETEISALSTASAPANLQSSIDSSEALDRYNLLPNVKHVQGGRKPRYL